MRYVRPAFLAASASFALHALPVDAHVVAGNRVFPVTLTIDDPGVSDEVSIPAFTYNRSGSNGGTGPGHEFDFGAAHEFVASLGVIREIGGTGTTHTGGDQFP